MTDKPTALIAEDEPLLAQALKAELAQAWPELRIVATVGDGVSAVSRALALRPDVLFLDIRMPAQSGMEAAAALTDEWPDGAPFPQLVFVTAYEQYAVQAFEAQAADYLLKPVQPERLRKTIAKLREALARRAGGSHELQASVDRLRGLLAVTQEPCAAQAPLTMIQAGAGNTIQMVPIDDVLVFEAADKYVRVFTASREHLIRTPLKELLPRLDERVFWRVHRGTIVRVAAIEEVVRDEAGRLHLALRGRSEKIAVSRLYAHMFKAM